MPYNPSEESSMSWKPKLERRGRGIYLELVRRLEEDIASGTLKPGTRLPPQRDLANFLDLNVSTVAKAFKLCELKGLLTATVGSGTFVAYSALTDRRYLNSDPGKNVIDMGTVLPEDSANRPLMEMAQQLFRSEGAENFFSFQARDEDEWQKDAAVKLMEYCGHRSRREDILFANGGQNALSAILASLFRGGKIAVDDHTYPGIKSAAAMFGVKLVPVRTSRDGMDPADLERICFHEKIHGVYLISACHNPTTATLSVERRAEIASIARRHDAIIVEDGTYQLLQRARPVSDFAPERSIYIATLSKVIAPGLRSAFISVPHEYRSAVADALYSLNVGVVPMMIELSARVIASGLFESIVATHKACTSRRGALVRRWLPGAIGEDFHIYRWLPLPEGTTGGRFERAALGRGVRVFAAERFAVGKTHPARAVRVGFCTPHEDELERGLRILADLLQTRPAE